MCLTVCVAAAGIGRTGFFICRVAFSGFFFLSLPPLSAGSFGVSEDRHILILRLDDRSSLVDRFRALAGSGPLASPFGVARLSNLRLMKTSLSG